MEYRRQIASIIEVEEIHDIIDQGTTMPVRCRLKNGMNVIVKYMRNPAGQLALINEWIGACIADIMGITIPEYGICHMSSEVIENTNHNEEIDYRNVGYAFYTKAYPQAIPAYTSGILSFVRNCETEKILLYDHLVNNHDRHNGNLICDISNGAILIAIDNSHIITEEPRRVFDIEEALDEKYIISNRVMYTNRDIYELMCTRVGYRDERLRECALYTQAVMDEDVLREIRDTLPKEWCDSVGAEKVEQLFEVLRRRIELLEDIATMIIEERRKL